MGPRSTWISTHLSKMCKESFSSQHELFNILGGNMQKVDSVAQKETGYEDLQRCYSVEASLSKRECICSRQVWIHWYPCTLKYCRNRDGDGEHRCGIKTCQKCLTFRYKAKSKSHCSWDEPWKISQKFMLTNKIQKFMWYVLSLFIMSRRGF